MGNRQVERGARRGALVGRSSRLWQRIAFPVLSIGMTVSVWATRGWVFGLAGVVASGGLVIGPALDPGRFVSWVRRRPWSGMALVMVCSDLLLFVSLGLRTTWSARACAELTAVTLGAMVVVGLVGLVAARGQVKQAALAQARYDHAAGPLRQGRERTGL